MTHDATIWFYRCEEKLPTIGEGSSKWRSREVLVRAFGEDKKHYVYVLAVYEVKTASKRWTASSDSETLWFEPMEWAELPQP